MHRERLTDNATSNGAVKPLVHAIFREGHLGQAILIGHHELPDGIHLLSEGARLFPQLVFHLGMLVCGSPNQVRAERHRQQHGDQAEKFGFQLHRRAPFHLRPV